MISIHPFICSQILMFIKIQLKAVELHRVACILTLCVYLDYLEAQPQGGAALWQV